MYVDAVQRGEEHKMKDPSVLLGTLERFGQDGGLQQNWGAGAAPDCGAQHNSENLELPGQSGGRGKERRWTGERKPRACIGKVQAVFSFGEVWFCQNCGKG